ncbi:MAG TPA: AI-2E family transporter [Burkholderiaceae bacterium]|nr:AI-2E family transporter [Burkholderiaceae bacterium]
MGKALFAIALLFVLQLAKAILLPFAVALMLTFLLFGPVRLLTRIGVPSSLGAAVVVAAMLGAVGVVGNALAQPATDWWERAPSNLQQLGDMLDRLRAAIPGLEPPRKTRSAAPTPDPVKEQLKTEGFTFTRAVLLRFWHFAVSAAATVILLNFMLASEYRLLSRTVEAIRSRRKRAVVLAGVRQAQREIGTYLGTMFIINSVLGMATAFVLSAVGLPNPAFWGTVIAVFNFVPYLGPMLVACMLLLAGSLTFGVALQMLAPAAAFLALHGVESNFVTPIVVGRRLRLSPMAVFLSVMFWGWMWGIAGAFIAVPMLLAIRATCRRVRRWRLVYHYLEETPSPPTSLRALLRRRRRAPPAVEAPPGE